MRILFARNLFYPADFGGNRYPFEVCSRLLGRGHQLTVVTGDTGARDEAFESHPRLSFLRYPINRSRPQLTHITNVVGSWRTLSRLRSHDFDALVTSSYDVGLTLSWLRHWPAEPRTFIYHSRFYHEMAHVKTGIQARAARAYVDWVQRRVLASQDRVIGVSEFSAEEIRQAVPGTKPEVHVVSTGVDTATFAPMAKREARQELGLPDRPTFMSFGRLASVKRVDVLLEAARMLKGRGHAFQLLIAGTGPQDEKLRQLAASLGLDDEVRFLGYLEPPRARIALSAADLVVSTSLFENRSLAMLEAFACGTPVMGTPGGGTPELLRMLDPRLIFAGMDAEDVAAGLGAALGPDFGLSDLSARARQMAVECFDWDVIVGELEELFARPRA